MNNQTPKIQMTPEQLKSWMESQFPRNATSWSMATDEVRDLCRNARQRAGVSEEEATNFRNFTTPAQWNSHGIDDTIRFYTMLSEENRQGLINDFDGFFQVS